MSERVLPTSWRLTPLSNLIERIEAGKNFRCAEAPPTDEEVGIVKISAVTWGNFDENESKTIQDAEKINPKIFIKKGDLLISRANTIELVGASVIVKSISKKLQLSDKVLRIILNTRLEEWINYFINSAPGKLQIMALATGAQQSMRNISQRNILRIEIPLPPLNEQHRIVEKIDRLFAQLDKGEEALRRVQTLLEQYRQSVLKAAVTGELTADWRAKNAHRLEHGKDLLERILQTRRDNWQGRGKYKEPTAPDTTDLPELPEGWVWVFSEQITTKITDGTHHSPPNGPQGEFKYITAKNIKDWGIDLTNITYVSTDIHNAIYSRCDVQKGDLLYIKDGATTGVCTVNDIEEPFSLLSSVGVLRPAREYDVNFLKVALDSPQIHKQLLGRMSGSAITRLTLTKLKSIPLPLPPLEEQMMISDMVARLLTDLKALAYICQTELTRSATLRQSILKDAFAGKLVPQDPNDEPASELLARICAGREAAKQVKKTKKA